MRNISLNLFLAVGKCAISTGIAGSVDQIFSTVFSSFTEADNSFNLFKFINQLAIL